MCHLSTLSLHASSYSAAAASSAAGASASAALACSAAAAASAAAFSSAACLAAAIADLIASFSTMDLFINSVNTSSSVGGEPFCCSRAAFTCNQCMQTLNTNKIGHGGGRGVWVIMHFHTSSSGHMLMLRSMPVCLQQHVSKSKGRRFWFVLLTLITPHPHSWCQAHFCKRDVK